MALALCGPSTRAILRIRFSPGIAEFARLHDHRVAAAAWERFWRVRARGRRRRTHRRGGPLWLAQRLLELSNPIAPSGIDHDDSRAPYAPYSALARRNCAWDEAYDFGGEIWRAPRIRLPRAGAVARSGRPGARGQDSAAGAHPNNFFLTT